MLTVTNVGGAATAASNGALAFIPATSITDGGGNPSAGSFTTSVNFRLF
jgi:hypothetical protein